MWESLSTCRMLLTSLLLLLRWAGGTRGHAVCGRAAGLEAPLGAAGRAPEVRKEDVLLVHPRPALRHSAAPHLHNLPVSTLLPR